MATGFTKKMNLSSLLDILAGGPGSGCNPEVADPGCGPHPGEHTQESPATTTPPKEKKWRQFDSKKVGGYFRKGTVIAHMYQTLVAKEGEWHPISEFETVHAGKANISYRIAELKYTGKRSGLWHIERSGTQVRIFLKTAKEKVVELTDQQIDTAADLAKAYMALQEKHGSSDVPTSASKPLFERYYEKMGVKLDSIQAMNEAVKMWTGSVHYAEPQAFRKVAMDYYGRLSSDEYTGSHSNKFDSTEVKENSDKMKPAVLAMKAYASEYAKAHHVSVVYRGIGGNAAVEIRKAAEEGKSIEIPLNSLSSWSDSKKTARHFGKVVLKLKIDPDNVWAIHKATPWLFSSHSHENEYVIGTRKAKEVFKPEDIEVV